METNIPATFLGLNDKFTNERFYYDNTRTIVADRKSDTRADWYALDLLRRGETQDSALDNPTFDINNGKKDQTIKPTKVYFIPLKDGGYRRTSQAQDAILPNGQYYPGTIVSYEYVNEEGKRNDTYNFRADLKEKKKYNIDESYDTEGGSVNLFTEKVSNQALLNGYLAYVENPYPVMRINKNFDMVSCFNDRINAPVYDGSKGGVFLDIHEDVSGDYLLSRLNESIDNPSGTYRLKNLLQPKVPYEGGVYLNNGNKTDGQAMEELMKKIYFYGEEVKKEYSKERNNEEMHRMVEASMYQRVIHHFTDGKALSEDYFDAPSNYNVDDWKVEHTLQGNRKPYPKEGWDDSFEGTDKDRTTDLGLRKLKDKETRIKDYPPVQKTQYEMAKRLYRKVIDSYKNDNNWDDDKADSVKLVFYSHTDEGKYQELIAGRVMAPIEIDKYKRSGDKIFAEKLPGAEFKFTNVATGESKEWTSPKENDKVNKLYLRPGTYKVQEINTPTGYEKIKDFEITVKSTEINPDDGKYNAKKLPKIHVNDGYKTEVVLAGNLPQTPDGKALVKIDEKNNIKVNVANIEDNLGKLEFIKRNKFVKLNGAEFRLRKINAKDLNDAKTKFKTPENLTYDAKYDKKSQGSYGEFKFEQIPAGFYVLEETKIPEGYEKAPLYLLEAKEVTDTDNKKKVEVSFVQEYKEVTNEKGEKEAKIANANLEKEQVKRDGKTVDLPIIRNKTKKTEIKFRKVRTENLGTGEEHLGLGDAKFRLMSLSLVDGDFYLKEDFTDHSEPTNEGEDRVDGQQARGGGYITFDGLKAGEYLLEELQAPKGYNKTTLYGWKLVVSELKADDEKTGKKKGDLDYKLYEVPTGKDLNNTNLKEVKLDDIINGKDKKIKAFQIGNDARKISVPFKKYKGNIVEKDGKTEVETEEVNKKLFGENEKAVSFDLYKSDFYGAIIGEKDESGNIKPYKKNITQDANGNFNLEGLEFGGYYILRETNPPKGYDKAADITLKVEAEAIADEGKMKVIVRDPNTNAKTDLHSVFQGVIDFKEGEKLGKFSIKKVGNAIGQKDDKGNPIKVGLRRAYFRLYTANDKYEIEYKDPKKKYPKEYIQKVTPGDPITHEEDGKQVGTKPEDLPPNQGIVTFDNLKPGKYVLEEYRGPAGYERDPNYWYILVEENGTVKKYRDNPKNTTDPRTVDGNLIEIFNKDETGFRIPLRISKVNENKAALTGSQFKARKLVNGEKVKLYEKNDDGKYIDTGKYGHPKYYNEKFDGVSEATGKPGDNYFRELTPGIYELTEIKTPNDSYRLPKDKDGNDMKWYFKVVINKDKVPSDAGYMDITFDFEHTFKETDDFNSAITEEEKKALIGTTIKGFTRGDPDFARYIEEVKDDGRSDPARPDAPYKWIHDARVTNYKNKTKLGFMKKDSETHRNISGAVFSLRKAKLDKDGKLVFENNKPAYAPEKTTGEDGKPLTEAELNLQRVQPYDKDKKFAKAVSNEKLGVEFTNIDEGTYILEEIEPAKGYKKTDSFLAIKFTEGEDGAWKQEVKAYAKDKDGVYKEMSEPNDFVGRDDDGEFVSVKNDKAYTKLKFQKIEGNKDSKGNEVPVESADFRLTQVDKDGKKIPGGYDKPLYSYGNSNFEFTNIPVGRYKLQETRAITKFEKPDPWFFNVVQDPESHKLKIVFEKDPKNDPNGKLDESIGFKTEADGSPDYDADGNLQDIKIRNYSKTSFSFMKYKNETDEKDNKLPLKDAYFRLTKVRYSMDEGSKSYEYYGEDKDAVLKKYTNGKKVTEYKPDGTIEKYTYDGIVIENGNDNYKPDSISSATGKYSSLRRSQSDGSVDFQDLGEGIYQLEEVGIPDGYESGNDQTKWIFEVKKTDNGLKVDHNVKTEKNYFENYDTSTYYKDFYKDYYEKVYSENATNPKPKPNIEGDEKNGYSITNTKATTNLKWKKIGSRNKDVIKKYTKFALLKTSDNPDDIDYDINSKDEKEVEKVKNAISGQSKYPPYLVESKEGIFEIKDLSKGIYNLIETDAPEGYEKATRKIAIKVYEDKNGAIQKQFYEIDKDGNLIRDVGQFDTLLTRNQKEVDTDTDEDGNKVFYFKNKSKPYHFDLSKVYKENGDFKDITKGKLKVRIKADPADKTNTDKNVYEQTIDLSDAKSYRINLNSDIKLGKDYILEEVESPDGYAKTNYRYRLRFAYNTSWDTPFVATLVAVLKEVENKDGTKKWVPLTNSEGKNISDSNQDLGNGKSIKSGFQFRIVNNKTEIEFTKVGKDEVKGTGGKIEYKYPPLKDVEFYLEKQDSDDIHKDNQGYYPLTENMEMIKPETDDKGNTSYYYIDRETGEKVTETRWLRLPVTPENSRKPYKSDADGKFKITDLTDGYYRIKEPQAPKGYMQVLGAVKKFKVDQGRVYVFEQDNATGQEVAKELTDANKKDLGKIINLKHGEGKFELNKTDEKNDPLENVEFELYNSEGQKVEIKQNKTDKDGKITFEGLPYGTYWLRETKTKDGYIVDRRIRQVRLGKDWNVPSKPSKPKDVTKKIKFDGSQPQLKSIGSQTSSYKTVYPNQQEAMLAYFKFKIADGADVKPGDTFTLKFSDNVDLYGIYVDNNGNGNVEDDNYYNIYSDAGLVAKAMVNPDKRSITYTFTEYLDNYNVENMRLSLQLYADRYKVPFSQNINVTASVGKSIYRDDIYVDYRGYTEGQSHIGYQDPRVDVSSYMLRLNPDTGEFTTVVYYNPWNDTTSNNRYFEFSTSAPVDIDNVKLFEKTGYGSHVDRPRQGDLPDSYGIAFENANSYAAQGLTKKTGTFAAKDYTYQNYYMYIDPNGGTNDSTYVMVIQGKLKNISTTKSLKTTAYYNFPYWNYNYWENNNYGYFHTWSQFYRPEGTSQGTPTEEEPLKLDLVNFKNRIEFMKVDGGVKANVVDTAQTDGTSLKDKTPGSALANAKFKLQFKEDKNGKWTETNYGEKTSDDKGFFSWEALAPGYYQVIETETPDNSKYDLPKEPVATFRVDEYGNIVDVVPDDLILENYKKAEIKIRKTDQDGEPLKGADFTLTPTSGQKDPSNPKENYKIITKTTGEDGIATFDKLVVGKYTLTEEKAPDGYKKTDREYYLEVTKDGKVIWTNSFYDSYNNMKIVDVKTYTGDDQENLRSEIVGIDKENKKFRQIVTITAKSSELEKARLILESKDKEIKLSQANTEVRVVQYDGNEIKAKDDSTYTVDINNGVSPNLTLRINPPYRNKDENKSAGSDDGTSPKENDGDIVRTYKVIVDMPYGEDETLGAKVTYDIGIISEITGKVEFTPIDEVKEVEKYAAKNNYFAHRDHTSPLNYKAQYLPRDINLITTDIANIKQPDIYLKKVDADDKTALAGAEFELQKKVGDVYKSISNKGKVIDSPTDNTPKWTTSSDGQGNFEFKSIPDGEYRVYETKAPTGYALSDKTVYKFKVKKGKIYKVNKDSGIAESTELVVGTDKKPNSDSNRIEITNKKAQYPYTGGPGTWIGFTILGALTMTAAGIYLAQKKKYQTK
ncbi:SpaA isopeptide-forming pilin-related protein [uncultured Anaerococcus sp.]|uniref:SpaA isopeptide-forming pilin-related protein n=1 Tax=uncultured Anaerococcus sp. TaxID=293428 RepID=UPI00280437ED|nr:SpaA isopeptide-forming pilin-related protein [uncultured Anaerococcus sp.]